MIMARFSFGMHRHEPVVQCCMVILVPSDGVSKGTDDLVGAFSIAESRLPQRRPFHVLHRGPLPLWSRHGFALSRQVSAAPLFKEGRRGRLSRREDVPPPGGGQETAE